MKLKNIVMLSLGARCVIVGVTVVLVMLHYAFMAVPTFQETVPLWFDDAASLNDVKIALDNRTYDVNAYYQGRTGLMRAMALPGEEKKILAELLLQYGANPNLKEDEKEQGSPSISLDPGSRTQPLAFSGNTALHIAAFMSNLPDAAERIALLLRYGADPSIHNGLGDTALHALRDMSPSNIERDELSTIGGFAVLMKMLVEGGADINARDKFGLTLLHMAVERNAFPFVKIIKDQYGSIVDFGVLDNRGMTAACLASSLGWGDLGCEVRIAHAATIPCPTNVKELYCLDQSELPILGEYDVRARDTFKRTGLMVAIMADKYDFAGQQIENDAEVNAEDERGYRPLHYAALQRHEPATYIKLLLDNLASVNVQTNFNKDTPLHFAVDINDPLQRQTAVKALLGAQAQVTIQNAQGDTPLHKAVRRNRLDIIKILRDANPLTLGIRNKDELTPRDIAARLQYRDALAALG